MNQYLLKVCIVLIIRNTLIILTSIQKSKFECFVLNKIDRVSKIQNKNYLLLLFLNLPTCCKGTGGGGLDGLVILL